MSNVEVGRAPDREGRIKIHGAEAFDGMRNAGQLAAKALDMLTEHVKPGVTTDTLDALVLDFALDHGAVPAPLNYRGFPKSICTSINHVVCHGIPGPKPLREGDIVNIDVTLILDGWHGDTSRMYAIGAISRRAERLIHVTYEALKRGIAAVEPGATTGHIGAAIQSYAESERCSVVRDFCGHGLGRVFHDRPNILHYGEAGEGVPNIFYEDVDHMKMRAKRVTHPRAWSQKPPHRTTHVVSNVLVESFDPASGEVVVRSRFHMIEFRREARRHFAGSYRHWLVRTPDGYRIKLQRVDLVDGEGTFDYVIQTWV